MTIPNVGDEIAGKYRIEQVIGQGGMGAVFAARNTLTGKLVAIKWLLPEHAHSVIRERLLREARLAASIEHKNVVDIYDVGEHQGGLFLVMEYLRGRSLSALMLERGRFEPRELILLLMPAMRGVHAGHLAGVIHRDLKPDNIILSESDGELVPKVVDFGVSKAVGVSAIPDASLTRTGALVGTPHYMALEQIEGSMAVDARTDVYAFGVLLYRGLTGEYPFDGSSVGQVILNIGTKELRSMRLVRPELPAELDAVVLRALARDLNARFGSLEELARALMPFAASREPGVQASWQGSWGAGSVPPQSLSILGAQRSTLAEASPAAALKPTTPVAAQPPRNTLRVVAATLLGATALSALLVHFDVLQFAADAQSRPAVSASQTRAVEPAAGAATSAVSTKASESPRPIGELRPQDEAAREEQVEHKLDAPSNGIPAGRAPSSTRSAAAESLKAAPPRGKSERILAPPRTSTPANRILGKRTNGFSLDEF